jgi:hypothetical protein
MKFMEIKEIEETYGKIEYDNLDGGWVRITNSFEKLNIIRKDFPLVGKKAVHKLIVPALNKALHVIERSSMFDTNFEYIVDFQTFAPRHVMNNPKARLSCHSYGIAFDINPSENMPGVKDYKIPKVIVDTFENVGFIWGGRMKIKDWMHFEVSREFIDFAERWKG